MISKTLHEIEYQAWSERASYYDEIFAHISTQAIEYILDRLGDLRGKRHLDVACGTGHLVAAASKRGAVSEGTDFAETMIDVASVNYPQYRFSVADAVDLPYENNTFDAVTCSFGLLHLEYPQKAEYSRSQNPARFAYERGVADLESGKRVFAFASGMARFPIDSGGQTKLLSGRRVPR